MKKKHIGKVLTLSLLVNGMVMGCQNVVFAEENKVIQNGDISYYKDALDSAESEKEN